MTTSNPAQVAAYGAVTATVGAIATLAGSLLSDAPWPAQLAAVISLMGVALFALWLVTQSDDSSKNDHPSSRDEAP